MTVAELITQLSQYNLDDHVTGIYLPALPIGQMNVGRARLMNLADGSPIADSVLQAQIALRSEVV